MQPEEFEERIVLAVCGLNPQIITELIYGLAVVKAKPFIPTKIILITTREGAERAQLTLLEQDGHFKKLCKEYQLPEIVFQAQHIIVLKDSNGDLLEDIREPQDNECTANQIMETMLDLTANENSALHVSIAGGRKTMGYYLGYALSLFGRQQDRLSHVLVPPEYESHPKFFYPRSEGRIIYTWGKDPRPLNAKNVEIHLADIPFFRLRDGLPKRLLNGESGFSEVIRQAQLATGETELIIDKKRGLISASGIVFNMPDVWFAFYAWLTERRKEGMEAFKLTTNKKVIDGYTEEFLNMYCSIVHELRDTETTEQAFSISQEPENRKNRFMEYKSRINEKLKEELGMPLAALYQIHSTGPRGNTHYEITLDAEKIYFSRIWDYKL